MKKTALITGASAGLGAQFAQKLAAAGHDLILIARSQETLSQLADSLNRAHGGSVRVYSVDLTQPQEVQRLLQALDNTPVDLLINNAGFGTAGLFADNDVVKCQRLVRLQVDAINHLTHAILPGMIERGNGNIINVGSAIAFMAQRYNVAYAATKMYLVGFSNALSRELQHTNVHVQLLLPGLTRTDFYDTPELRVANLSKKIPEKYWMTSEAVVTCSLRALSGQKRWVVPGWKNKFFIFSYLISDLFSMCLPVRKKIKVGEL